MDPISFGIGIASIASIFQTCIHGYRTLNTAMEIGENALTLNVQFRVEELRLYLWGRHWGLIRESSKSRGKDKSGSDTDDETDGSNNAEGAADSSRDLVDEDLEIPGLRDLTVEVLGRIQKALEDWKAVGQRYGAAAGNKKIKSLEAASEAPKETLKESVSKVSSKQSGQEKEISDRTRFTTKLRWAIKDKATLEELLSRLTNLNDSLEKLLPRRERASLARGLAGEILNALEGGSKETYGPNIDEQLDSLSGVDEVKAARIMRLKRSNFTEIIERVPAKTEDADSNDAANGPTPFSKYGIWTDGEQGSMHIPFEYFIKLAEPKIQYYETQESTRGRFITGRYVPLQRSLAVYAPPTTSVSISSAEGSDSPAQATLVEWRPTAHESRASKLSENDLKERRDHIARLLHRTSVTDVDFRVLDCLGYTDASAHTPDGETHGLVGYVYQYPEFATPKSLPFSLRDLLGDAYNSDDPRVPPLEERFKLARSLAIALYQLQCAGWVHRKISSYNIIFFKDRKTEELDLSHPFLTGWQYSRPDDQRRLYPSEGSAEGIGDLDMYVHRARVADLNARFPRFRKSFDIYSLGVVLMEIAFWEPIMALAPEDERIKMSKFEDIGSGSSSKKWWEAISKTASKELAPEMGNAYKDAVMFCLNASGDKWDQQKYFREDTERNPRDPYFVETEFEEVGIEKDFFWSVLKPLEKLGL